MRGNNNLPPGVTESDLPGNRPEEETVSLEIELEQGEIDELEYYNAAQLKLPASQRDDIWSIVFELLLQIRANL